MCQELKEIKQYNYETVITKALIFVHFKTFDRRIGGLLTSPKKKPYRGFMSTSLIKSLHFVRIITSDRHIRWSVNIL